MFFFFLGWKKSEQFVLMEMIQEEKISDAGERGGAGLSPEQGQFTVWDPVRWQGVGLPCPGLCVLREARSQLREDGRCLKFESMAPIIPQLHPL